MKEFRFFVTANECQDKKEYLETARTYMNKFWEMMDTCLSVRRPDISVKGLRLKDGILAVRAECRGTLDGNTVWMLVCGSLALANSMHDTQVNVKIKMREIEQAKRTSRCCAGCGYWKDVDDLYYGLCTCSKASENGVRTMGFHRCSMT